MSNIDYFQHRARAERQAALKAANQSVAKVHREFAAAYEKRIAVIEICQDAVQTIQEQSNSALRA
jgi:hypothetical protein